MKQHTTLKHVQVLTLALFISGAFNLLLLACLFFWMFLERPPIPYCEMPKPIFNSKVQAVSPTNEKILMDFKALKFEGLVEKLQNKKWVEDGFSERDLALGILITFHEFDIEKALGYSISPSKMRVISFKEGKEKILLLPSLTEENFQRLYSFIKTEKWPYKPQGLYQLLKSDNLSQNLSLQEAFFFSEEFQTFKELFPTLTSNEILNLMKEGDWGLTSAIVENHKKNAYPAEEERRKILLNFLQKGSKTAAQFFLKIDYDYATKRLSDQTLLGLLRLLDDSDENNLKVLLLMSAGPRGDQLKEYSLKKYQSLTGKPYEPLISRKPLPTAVPTFKQAPSKAPLKNQEVKKYAIYIVQEGDSLWKIGKRLKISVDEIRDLNQLKTDFLKPGISLKIPQGWNASRNQTSNNSKVVLR